MNFCPNCGTKLSTSELFCSGCGLNVTRVVAADRTTSTARKRARFSVLRVIFLTFACAFGLIFVLVIIGLSTGGRVLRREVYRGRTSLRHLLSRLSQMAHPKQWRYTRSNHLMQRHGEWYPDGKAAGSNKRSHSRFQTANGG